MTTYCIDVCGDTEESTLRRHNIPFEQLRDTLRDMLDQYHRITGEPVNGNDVGDEARDLLADCLIDAANKGIRSDCDNPMSAGDGLVEIWEEPDVWVVLKSIPYDFEPGRFVGIYNNETLARATALRYEKASPCYLFDAIPCTMNDIMHEWQGRTL